MILRTIVKPNRYADSVFLMSLASRAGQLEGIEEASALMGTPENKRLLAEADLLDAEGEKARPDDLIISLRADSEPSLQAAMELIEEWMAQRLTDIPSGEEQPPRTLDSALNRWPDAAVVLISVPGGYAFHEARTALRAGRHMMIFSDHVSVEDEVALKKQAAEAGLMVMGPDCGTALLDGKALGFGNVVRQGDIGIVGASGTGIQEVSTLLDRWGLGISQAIGLGSRDLSKAVGAAGALQAIKVLEADAWTEHIVFISKPPDHEVAEQVLKVLRGVAKPGVVCFQGGRKESTASAEILFSPTLEGTAVLVAALHLGKDRALAQLREDVGDDLERAKQEWSQLGEDQRYLRGLFSGGSLCAEAGLVLLDSFPDLLTNIHLPGATQLQDPTRSQAHSLVDLGADEFTVGVPHPMIDFTVRNRRLVQEAQDVETAVILFDVVLGYGAHPDPAGALLPAILEGRRLAEKRGQHLCYVASVCGAEGDPQGLEKQRQQLQEVGVKVMFSAAGAARFAAVVAGGGRGVERTWSLTQLGDIASLPQKAVVGKGSMSGRQLFDLPLKVINLGLPAFAQALTDQEVPVLHVDWRPPAGGDAKLLDVLRKLG